MVGEVKFSISTTSKAKPEKIIDTISDWNKLPEFWHGMREISGSQAPMLTVKFAFPGTGRMTYACDLETLTCTENYLGGPFTGFKEIRISPADEGSVITVKWDIKLSLKLLFMKSFVTKHFRQGTENAIKRIAQTAEDSAKMNGTV
ncbi:MAG: SRPBCC family protein [Candidatus Thermoplasmatota archaeon]|nr:SRPBCC family protein [Candidatus Thermoplasmatota archaeon]MDA8142893.1 SRPBCC family protein [Thermoplasmatales archaeon]